MKTTMLTIALVSLVAACSPPDYQVTKPGGTYEDKMTDLEACRAKSYIAMVDPVIKCMRDKGWRFIAL